MDSGKIKQSDEVLLSSKHLQRRCLEMTQEKGASSWLNVLPIKENGFVLHKSEFRDALSLRYNWSPDRLPAKCACGEGLSISHAMDCHARGFPSRPHNEIQDITAELISEVCHGASVEPPLQSLNGETFTYQSTNTADDARTDICASGFWGNNYQ